MMNENVDDVLAWSKIELELKRQTSSAISRENSAKASISAIENQYNSIPPKERFQHLVTQYFSLFPSQKLKMKNSLLIKEFRQMTSFPIPLLLHSPIKTLPNGTELAPETLHTFKTLFSILSHHIHSSSFLAHSGWQNVMQPLHAWKSTYDAFQKALEHGQINQGSLQWKHWGPSTGLRIIFQSSFSPATLLSLKSLICFQNEDLLQNWQNDTAIPPSAVLLNTPSNLKARLQDLGIILHVLTPRGILLDIKQEEERSETTFRSRAESARALEGSSPIYVIFHQQSIRLLHQALYNAVITWSFHSSERTMAPATYSTQCAPLLPSLSSTTPVSLSFPQLTADLPFDGSSTHYPYFSLSKEGSLSLSFSYIGNVDDKEMEKNQLTVGSSLSSNPRAPSLSTTSLLPYCLRRAAQFLDT